MRLIRCKDYDDMSKKAADLIISNIVEKPQIKLGLATGSTPIGVYENLAKAKDEGEISFKFAKSVNLDEYVGIDPKNENSYRYFMQENLFSKVDFKQNSNFIPKAETNDDKYAKEFDKLLDDFGQRDIQILGIGENGHIAFNEPADKLNKRTSIVSLTESTIKANSRFFNSEEEVPKYAISMGMSDIFNSKMIILLASGSNKAKALKNLLEDTSLDTNLPAGFLNLHPNVYVFADEDALNY